MKLKRLLALGLSLCMLLSLALAGNAAYAVEEDETSVTTEDLTVNEVDGSGIDAVLPQNNAAGSGLERLDIAADEAVKVIIVMEGDSIIEKNSDAVPDSKTEAQSAALERQQASVVAEIEDTVLDGESLDVAYHYTWLLNGVAAEVPYGTVESIKAVDGVKQVLIQPVYEVCTTGVADPKTNSDGVMIGRESTWAQGYTGKGIKIAILDTGIDIDHPNFQALDADKLTADSATEATVAAVLDKLQANARLDGALTVDDVWYSTKVAYAFNYCDDDLDITHDNDTEGDHGTHVAGIAAANKVEGSDVVGVAPDAQLYVMKVFGKNGGAYTQDILAALEDALMLGADVVNMSLGSPAGFTSDGEEIDAIYARVAETNTVLSISAGNEYTSGYGNAWGTDTNLTLNVDNATVGSPGTYANVLSVASVENVKVLTNYIDAEGYQIAYFEDGANNEPLTSLTGAYELVAVPGYGEAEDFEGLDVAGKVALVMRGSISFYEKCDNAAAAGALGCIIFNNTSGTIHMNLDDCTSTIPCVSISMSSGLYLLNALEENPGLTVSFPAEKASIPNEEAYQMSDFSGWGVAPDLTLEPDITAPGGNIYSTLDGGTYGLMSGTSMAAPNLAGMSALVMQYVRENFPAGTDCRTLVRDLLMSTSVPLSYGNEGEIPYSPRQQGSGLANAFNAVTTQAYLTVDGCDTAKAELGDDPGRTGSYSFTFDVNNISDTPAYYDLDTVAQTELADDTYADYGLYFMSGAPAYLDAATAEQTDGMVLTHDVDDNGETGSHDAYLIWRAATGAAEDASWSDVSFRYDANCDEGVDTADVQAYLDALVGNDSDADLAAEVLRVDAGETVEVAVSVELTDGDMEYFDYCFPNGCYVEGYTFLTARNAGGVDLSLPYLAFYGDWTDADVLDWGTYWDENYNQHPHVLWTYVGENDWQPGVNPYFDEEFDPAHISVSPNGDGYCDVIDDIYVSLLRNAAELTFRYTDLGTGEVYYEQTADHVSKSVYWSNYGQIIPFIYSWIVDDYGLPLYDWTDLEGNGLANNTQLLLEVDATGVAPKGDTNDKVETWAVPITVDLEAPELLDATKRIDWVNQCVNLELTFRDNLSTAAVILLSEDGEEIYDLSGVEDVEPDEEGYQTCTLTFDITDYFYQDIIVVLGDYACNESYYQIGVFDGYEFPNFGDWIPAPYSEDAEAPADEDAGLPAEDDVTDGE